MLAVRDELFGAINAQMERFERLRDERFPEINRMAREAGMDFISVP